MHADTPASFPGHSDRSPIAQYAAGTPLPLFGIAAALGAGLGAISVRSAHRFEPRFGLRRSFWLTVIVPALVYLAMAAFERPYLAALLYVAGLGLMQLREPLIASMRNIHMQSYNRATAISLISMGVGAWTLGGKLLASRPESQPRLRRPRRRPAGRAASGPPLGRRRCQ